MNVDTFSNIRSSLAAGDIRRAEASIARLLRTEPAAADHAHLLTLRARARLLAARYEEALDDVAGASGETQDPEIQKELLELKGDAYFARFELASVGFAERSDLVQAQSCYMQLLADFPDYENIGWVHYQRGRIYLIDGQSEPAMECFTTALLTPSTVPGLTAYCFERLGFIHVYERRDLRRAAGLLDKALYTYPSSESQVWTIRLQILRARVLRELNRNADAILAVETAVATAEQFDETKSALADALLAAGEVYAQIGGHDRETVMRLQQYLQNTRKPLGVDVTWSRVHEMLGAAYFNIGQFVASADAYKAALQYNPYHPWEVTLQYQIAHALYRAEDYEQTITALDKLFKASSRDGQPVTDYRIYDILGSAQFARKHYRAALQAFDQALAMAPANVDTDKMRRYRQFAAELQTSH